MTIDVTIVIAAWNASQHIGGAVASALAQTGVSLEIIVVNDASTDDTREIVEAFADPRVRLIDHEVNQGPAAARNTGFTAAQGRWIAVLDADDSMLPDRLKDLVGLGERQSSQIVIDNIWVSQAGRAKHLMFPEQDFAAMAFLDLATFIASNTLFSKRHNLGYTKPLFRRDFILDNAIAYDTDIRIGEDFLFMAEALAKGARCAVLPSAGYVYTIQDGSISRVLQPKDVAVMLEADERAKRRFQVPQAAMPAMNRRHRSLLEGLAFLTCVDHLKARQPVKALKALARQPRAIFLFRMPIAARLSRILLSSSSSR